MVNKTVKDAGKSYKVSLDNDLAFLWPYVLQSKKFGVPVWKIKKIVGYWVPPDKVENQSAQIIKPHHAKKYTITLLKKFQDHAVVSHDDKSKRVITSYTHIKDVKNFEETLHSLAHELAHIVHWHHTPEHLIFTARLFLSFTRKARQVGYKGYD